MRRQRAGATPSPSLPDLPFPRPRGPQAHWYTLVLAEFILSCGPLLLPYWVAGTRKGRPWPSPLLCAHHSPRALPLPGCYTGMSLHPNTHLPMNSRGWGSVWWGQEIWLCSLPVKGYVSLRPLWAS